MSNPTLTVVVPAYNEEAALPSFLPELIAYCEESFSHPDKMVQGRVNDSKEKSLAAAAAGATGKFLLKNSRGKRQRHPVIWKYDTLHSIHCDGVGT